MVEIDDMIKDNYSSKDKWIERMKRDREIAYKKLKKKSLAIGNNMNELAKALEIQTKFEMYSVGNCILIQDQMPDAIYCREYNKWINDGYIVKRRDKSIIILEPSEPDYKDDGTRVVYYNPKRVYDVSATNALPPNKSYDYSPKTVLMGLLKSSPLKIESTENVGHNNKCAFYDKEKNIMYVCKGKSVEATIQDLTTELAKYLLDKEETSKKETNKFKATCISYMFCNKFGIPFPNEEFKNLTNELSGTDKEIRDELTNIKDTYSVIKANMVVVLEKSNKSKEQVR